MERHAVSLSIYPGDSSHASTLRGPGQPVPAPVFVGTPPVTAPSDFGRLTAPSLSRLGTNAPPTPTDIPPCGRHHRGRRYNILGRAVGMWPVKSRQALRQSGISALCGSIAVGVLHSCVSVLGWAIPSPVRSFCSRSSYSRCGAISWPPAVVSILAVGSLDYFFLDPLFSFAVTSPSNILALVAFLVTALVITSLVSRVGSEARRARLQADRLDHLYRLAQQLLGLDPDVAVGQTFLDLFAGIFGTTAV